jgi:hypothetical protein
MKRWSLHTPNINHRNANVTHPQFSISYSCSVLHKFIERMWSQRCSGMHVFSPILQSNSDTILCAHMHMHSHTHTHTHAHAHAHTSLTSSNVPTLWLSNRWPIQLRSKEKTGILAWSPCSVILLLPSSVRGAHVFISTQSSVFLPSEYVNKHKMPTDCNQLRFNLQKPLLYWLVDVPKDMQDFAYGRPAHRHWEPFLGKYSNYPYEVFDGYRDIVQSWVTLSCTC